MNISISSVSSTVSSAANVASDAAAAQRPQPTANASADTVRLTEAQQVYQLYNQGQEVSQIATSLSLPVETVDSYLNITPTTG